LTNFKESVNFSYIGGEVKLIRNKPKKKSISVKGKCLKCGERTELKELGCPLLCPKCGGRDIVF